LIAVFNPSAKFLGVPEITSPEGVVTDVSFFTTPFSHTATVKRPFASNR